MTYMHAGRQAGTLAGPRGAIPQRRAGVTLTITLPRTAVKADGPPS
jgi:hypothetical protein